MIRKAVLDTNILISGMMWRGIPYELLGWAEKGVLSIYTSLDILTEVYRVLHYPKFQKFIDRKNTSPAELFSKIEFLLSTIVRSSKHSLPFSNVLKVLEKPSSKFIM